jgi:methionyl-tRNA formyltransferase
MPHPLRVAFAGTPEFASHALAALHAAGHNIVLVLTQPDRPAGRGMKLQASAVKQQALALGAPVIQPRSLRLDGKYPEDAALAQAALREAAPDVMVVAAYGLILPTWVLTAPPLGCINIHGSVLPRWRGAAPIHRAIEAGDLETGITIMQMDAGLDTGPMLLVQTEPIHPDDTTASLQTRLTALGAGLVVQALADLPRLQAAPQAQAGATYAHKIEKSEAAIDWQQSAAAIERRLRAFDPFPGCTASFGEYGLKVWKGRVVADSGAPGQVLRASVEGWVVACGEHALELLEVQAAGGKRVPASVFVQQHPELLTPR